MKLQKYNKGFTLIEMLGVLAIVVILLSISIISFRHSQAKARDVVRKTDLQMIADALISYNNDHGHFPSSIYDNVTNGEALSISAALNKIADGGIYQPSGATISYLPTKDSLPYLGDEYFSTITDDGGYINEGQEGYSYEVLNLAAFELFKMDSKKKDLYNSVISIIDNAEKETPTTNNFASMNYTIVTQGMCANSLKKYLVDEGYISTIPQDPSGEKTNLQTNICFVGDNVSTQGFTANDKGWSIQGDVSQCIANTNFGCTQICKEGYVYVSDGEHFALIAHMESENGGNYETTSCGSCEIARECKNTENKTKRTKTDQLPCDITDEFTNTFDCIQNTGVVEYATGQYYFYIY